MADPLVIACPECGKQARAPEQALGKKVRCKFCQAVFVARAGGKQASPTKVAKPPAKPTSVKSAPAPIDEDEDDDKPYTLQEVSFAARCPSCANEMDSEDARICLICGYDTRSRQHNRMVKIYDTTTVEHVAWLLPGIFCVLLILGVIGFNIWYLMSIDDLVGTSETNPDASWYQIMWTSGGIKLWVVITSLIVIFYSGRFAVKRLILHFRPPEVEKVK